MVTSSHDHHHHIYSIFASYYLLCRPLYICLWVCICMYMYVCVCGYVNVHKLLTTLKQIHHNTEQHKTHIYIDSIGWEHCKREAIGWQKMDEEKKERSTNMVIPSAGCLNCMWTDLCIRNFFAFTRRSSNSVVYNPSNYCFIRSVSSTVLFSFLRRVKLKAWSDHLGFVFSFFFFLITLLLRG